MRLYLLLAFCFSLKLLAQPVPELIKDIFPGPDHSYPSKMVEINDLVFFFANDGVHGIELWQSDGTETGTKLVKNIGEGSESYCESTYGCGPEYIVMNDVIYFRASDVEHGAELWRSDGTEAGTYMVKDINPGIGDCSNSFFMSGQYFTTMENVLYFAADGGGNNIELWRSDGTESGTYLVKDFALGESSVPQYISTIENAIYFQCKNAAGESEIWKCDGTEEGSVLLKKMFIRSYDYKGAFFLYNGFVYFAGDDDDFYDLELWRTDGTATGTQLFKNINTNDGDGSDPQEFHILNEKLLFSAKNENGDHLFVSDGTADGTIPLKDKNGNDFEVSPYYLDHLQGETKLYFNGKNEDDEDGLWVSDGTNEGTYFLDFIESGAFAAYSACIVNENNILYRGYDENNGCAALFQSDGTQIGTIQSIGCDIIFSPYEMISYNDKVILGATSDVSGGELWLVDPAFSTEVSSLQENNYLTIFPNPALDFLFVQINKLNHQEEIIIQNTFGEIVCSTILLSSTHSINVKELTPGIYFITINNETLKFIKQ